jgi:hypothetical protein
MHSDESLTLINRDGPDDSAEAEFRSSEKKLTAELVTAQRAGHRSPGAADAAAAAGAAQAWYGEHARVYDANYNGDYLDAVQLAINNSTQAFLRVDAALTAGIGADQAASAGQAASGDDALGGLAAGMVIAALLMAASCALGISKRIAEYRLAAIPGAVIQVRIAQPFGATATVAIGEERRVLFERCAAAYPQLARYQAMTTREIPIGVIARQRDDQAARDRD